MIPRFILAAALLTLIAFPAHARDGWQDRPSVCKDARDSTSCEAWVSRVKQHDTGISCCADGDAYIADDSTTIGGAFFAIVTEAYPLAQIDPSAPPTTKGSHILVPKEKVNSAADDGANPTGHGIVFASPGSSVALCYFSGTLG